MSSGSNIYSPSSLFDQIAQRVSRFRGDEQQVLFGIERGEKMNQSLNFIKLYNGVPEVTEHNGSVAIF